MKSIEFPASKEDLFCLRLDKSDLLSVQGINSNGIDISLPQEWLDKFVAKYGKRYNFSYQDVIYSTFWEYRTNLFGSPLSFMKEVDNALKEAGFGSFKTFLSMLKKGDKKDESR